MSAANSKLEKARSLLKSALAGVETELNQPSELFQSLVACGGTPAESPANHARKYLRDVHKELAQMLREVEASQIDKWHKQHTWLGQALTDGWPWRHPLTELVLKAENAYLKI